MKEGTEILIFKNLLTLFHWFGCKCIISVILDDELNVLKYAKKEYKTSFSNFHFDSIAKTEQNSLSLLILPLADILLTLNFSQIDYEMSVKNKVTKLKTNKQNPLTWLTKKKGHRE